MCPRLLETVDNGWTRDLWKYGYGRRSRDIAFQFIARQVMTLSLNREFGTDSSVFMYTKNHATRRIQFQ